MAIDPRISLGVQPIQIDNPLAQYGQVQNILAAQAQRQAAGTQNELAQAHLAQTRMSIREVQEAQEFVTKIMAAAKQNGAPTEDPMQAAMQMRLHPTNKTVQSMGEHLYNSLEKLRAYEQDKEFIGAPSKVASTTSQPLEVTNLPPAAEAKPQRYDGGIESYKEWIADKGTTLDHADWEAQKNALNDASKATASSNALAVPVREAVQQTNALAAPSKSSQLLAEINDLRTRFPYSPKAKEQIAFLTKQLEEATKPHVVGTNLVSGEGSEIYTGKAKDSEFEQLLNKSGLSEEDKKAMRIARARKESTHAPATVVNIDQKQQGAFEGGLGKGQSERILANQVVAQDAATILETNQIGRALLKSGAITGTGADFFVGFNNALKQAGVDFGYADAAANSQAYAAAMGANVGRIIKQFGAGTGLSDDDRKFAEQMAGGKISLTETALRRILDINDKTANRVIDLHNKNVSGIKTNIPLTVDKPTFSQSKSTVDQIPGQGSSNSVTLPDGRVKTFPNAEAAEQFKKAAGIK